MPRKQPISFCSLPIRPNGQPERRFCARIIVRRATCSRKNIQLKDLHVSPFNMRAEKKIPSLARMAGISANIIPSVREKGILQDLIVRKNNAGFEILAGRRRFYATKVVECLEDPNDLIENLRQAFEIIT
jgi:hypothetical protein